MTISDLQEQIENYLAPQSGEFAIVVTDLQTDQQLQIAPDKVFPSASLIKVPILTTLFQQASLGKLELSEELVVEKEQQVEGAGILHELRAGHRFSLLELATLMIAQSDNTATNLLIKRLGMATINDEIARLGLFDTKLQRFMMDSAARKAGRENLTTAGDMALLLTAIARGKCVDQAASLQMLDLLSKQQIVDRLDRYLPEELKIAHKTGDLENLEHDCGIVFLEKKAYVICVLTNQINSHQQGCEIIGKISKFVYDFVRANG